MTFALKGKLPAGLCLIIIGTEGAAFGVSESSGLIGGSLRSRNLDGALFGSFNRPNVYVDAVIGLGEASLVQTRTGSFGALDSRSRAFTVEASVRAAYLFDVGAFKVGPLVQAALGRITLGGFQESGDPLYTVAAGSQSVTDLAADIGVEARMLRPAGLEITPFVDFVLERHLLAAPAISSYFAALPTQLLPAASISYPRIALRGDAGVEFPLGGAWSGRVTASAAAGSGSSASYGVNNGVACAY